MKKVKKKSLNNIGTIKRKESFITHVFNMEINKELKMLSKKWDNAFQTDTDFTQN